MSLARGLERRLERLVDGIASLVFGGRIHPVELATRLIREADLAVFEGPAGPTVPNAFTITVRGAVDPMASATLRRELAEAIEDTAAERGWRLEGPAVVSLVTDTDEGRVTAAVDAGERSPWARLVGSDPRSLDICFNRVVVGRTDECDVVIPAAEVSRRHAVVWREAGRTRIVDADSLNGTFVNGRHIDAETEIVAGDAVAFAGRSFLFKAL